MSTFVGQLDDNKESITTAIDELAKLSTTLENDKGKIVSALDGLSPGLDVFADQREQLVSMLSALDKLSDVTVETLNASQKDIVADFESLEPILTQLAKSGEDLPKSLEILLTYPFPDSVLGAIKGDYLNVFLTTNFRTLPADCVAIGCAWPQVPGQVGDAGGGSPGGAAASRYAPPRAADAEDPSPTLLPPTSSPTPGYPRSTMPVPSPSTTTSTDAPTPSAGPSGTPSTPDVDPSPSRTPDPDPSDAAPSSEESDD